MISRIEGELVGIVEGSVELRCGAVTYSVLVPASDHEHLAGRVGDRIVFHALHYLEGQGQGTSFIPRLIGFPSADARRFFELLTTVKGLGARKALRALQMPYQTIAAAIDRKDVDLLVTLPEIGRRTAETIVAELSGKVEGFIELKPAAGMGSASASIVHDALAALAQLGEPKPQARRLIERALTDDPTLDSADALVAAAFRARSGDQGGAS